GAIAAGRGAGAAAGAGAPIAGATPTCVFLAAAATAPAAGGGAATFAGGAAIGAAAAGAGAAAGAPAREADPSLPTMKLAPHFGQRIFMPLSGIRFGSNSYGALQDTHSTLIMVCWCAARRETGATLAARYTQPPRSDQDNTAGRTARNQ